MMDRRKFLQIAAAGAVVPALLRAGDTDGAAQETAALYDKLGLKYWIYNVKDYGVKGDGITDDVPAIYDLFVRANRETESSPGVKSGPIYFFPAGRYMIGEKLQIQNEGPARGDKIQANYGCHLIGQGAAVTQIVLKSKAKGYDDPQNPQDVVTLSRHCGESMGMLIDGFSILGNEDGTNPGTIGLYWGMHVGISRNLILAAGHTCYVEEWGGLPTMENITCLGGRFGLMTRGGQIYRNVSCLGFSERGVQMQGRDASVPTCIYN